MDGWGSSRESKAVTEIKQTHRRGKGGHVCAGAAFINHGSILMEAYGAKLKPETTYNTCEHGLTSY